MRAFIAVLAFLAALRTGPAVDPLHAQMQLPPETAHALKRQHPASIAVENLNSPPGEATEKAKAKVVGGRDAQLGQFKWQVALILASAPHDDPFKGHFCGGSLVAWSWVLTAAHCTFFDNPADPSKPRPILAGAVDVYLGSHNFTAGQRLQVKRIVRHERYETETQDNDIALLELASPPQDLQMLELVPLAAASQDLNAKMTVIGWGATARGIVPMEQRTSVQNLQYLDDVRTRESGLCNRHLVRSLRTRTARLLKERGMRPEEIRGLVDRWYPANKQFVTDNMFCAGGSGGGDSCFGDSGGPLVIRSRRVLQQVGIVSWGPAEGCGLTDLYGVYTRLSNFRTWISKTTGGAVP